MKKLFFFILLFCCLPFNLSSASGQLSSSLYDAVRFVENDFNIIVDLHAIELLLNKGANPNWIKHDTKGDRSILKNWVHKISIGTHYAHNNQAIEEKGIKAVRLLFDHGAKLQYCDGDILFFPITLGHYELATLLLEKGASATSWPKAQTGADNNLTPVEEATKSGQEKIVKLLVSYGAKKINPKDAVQIRFIELAKFGTIEELRDHIKKGADANTKNRNGETALINSFSTGLSDYERYSKIIYLLDLGADVNLEGMGSFGKTLPLNQAILMSSYIFNAKRDKRYAEYILPELIKRGANISGRDNEGKTPLHFAAHYNNLYAARLLLKSGSKVMPKDNSGKTPLNYAKSAEMITLLKEHGAKAQ